MRNHLNQFEMSELHSLAEKSPRKKHTLKFTKCDMQLKYITNIDYRYMYPSSSHKNSSNTMENKIDVLGEFNSLLVDLSYRSKRHSMRNRSWETSCWPITRSGSSHVDEMFTA